MMVADNYMEPVSALPSKPISDNNNEKDGGEFSRIIANIQQNFSSLNVLNLSHNDLLRPIPKSIGKLKMFE
ncbi:hypothetical protein KY289_035730 [Solanum tuberosum]|nr:hypothetical protein KY289_035730 [Solanum tuberosum]